jgi:predicted transposase/invertase (TIGR01784 family)
MIPNPHDKYFKQLFSQKAEMQEFLEKGLPQVAKLLDLNTLELDTTSYIDKSLNVGFSDLVYSCNYYQNIHLKICLLFEHKSYAVTNPYLQMLGYMLKIWEQNIKQEQKLMPVIPILFYHAKDTWNYQPFENYFGEIGSDLKQYLPIFKYELVNTINWSDAEIQKMFSLVSLKIGVLVMKHIFDDPTYLLNELSKLFIGLTQLLETESGKGFFQTTVLYFLNTTKIKREQLKEKLAEISEEAVELVETGGMILRREGAEREKRLTAMTLIKKGLDDEFIMECTRLPIEEIINLREMEMQMEEITK